MPPFKSNELRESFLAYFESKGHRRERSSLLIPKNDPTLLFTNAGMVQFKDCFTGVERRPYARATTSQKCVRAGGKHNDLENVGFTRRHHTFFEMLGNFSFGDYFKQGAIEFAWEYITKTLAIDSRRLTVSVYEKDDEAAEIWKSVSGFSDSRIVRMGEADNFWAMGDTGPCGPCSEIYVDRGESFGKNGETVFDGGERFLEIWNLVFMQFERHPDGSMTHLPKPSVDTGMGLERLASVIQSVESNYLTDGLFDILQGYSDLVKKPYGKNNANDVALRVLTDHIRSVSFLLTDGVQPSNEGRGYVLRRILRRAIRYGKNLGMSEPFFYKGFDFLEKQMGAAYPELTQSKAAVKKIIQMEEEKFFETLESGLKLLEAKMGSVGSKKQLPGDVAFQLYDTYGFPLDLTEVILKEKGLTLDKPGFDKALEEQRERSRASWKGSGDAAISEVYKEFANKGLKSEFTGYKSLFERTKIVALFQGGKNVKEVSGPAQFEIVIEKCPFYAEGGGQVGDQGELKSATSRVVIEDTFKPVSQFHVLRAKIESGTLQENVSVEVSVNEERRLKTRINHSITHVLHATLQEVLGSHIKQAGSLVTPEYLRFDFSHYQGLTKSELRKIEETVNGRILENTPVGITEEDLELAIKGGAKAFFDDKYGEKVRVLTIGEFSKELCGGTHAERLGEAGLFKITAETSVAAGVRRIVAITGMAAYQFVTEQAEKLQEIASLLKAPEKDITTRVEKILKDKDELQKKLTQAKTLSAGKNMTDLIVEINGVKSIIDIVEIEDAKDLRPISDQYLQKIKSGVVLIGAQSAGRATVVVSVTDDIAQNFDTKGLVGRLSSALEGKGGGKPNFSQVGGANIAALTPEKMRALLEEHVKNIRVTV